MTLVQPFQTVASPICTFFWCYMQRPKLSVVEESIFIGREKKCDYNLWSVGWKFLASCLMMPNDCLLLYWQFARRKKSIRQRDELHVHSVLWILTLACIVVKMKDYTQNCYVGERMGLVGVGELYINNIVSKVYSIAFMCCKLLNC